MFAPITEIELAGAAAFFPPVLETCKGCNGTKRIPNPDTTFDGQWVPCPHCAGAGTVPRDMEPREEHSYLMHLFIQQGIGRPETHNDPA